MQQLISSYSFGQIFVFCIILSFAIKQFITFLDWIKERMNKQVDSDRYASTIEHRLDQAIKAREKEISKLKENESILQESINQLSKQLSLLIKSDRDDIKAWITSQHHHFISQGEIDYYSFQCITKRYQHYKAEGGNSFIDDLMQEINALPKTGKKVKI